MYVDVARLLCGSVFIICGEVMDGGGDGVRGGGGMYSDGGARRRFSSDIYSEFICISYMYLYYTCLVVGLGPRLCEHARARSYLAVC